MLGLKLNHVSKGGPGLWSLSHNMSIRQESETTEAMKERFNILESCWNLELVSQQWSWHACHIWILWDIWIWIIDALKLCEIIDWGISLIGEKEPLWVLQLLKKNDNNLWKSAQWLALILSDDFVQKYT